MRRLIDERAGTGTLSSVQIHRVPCRR
jgi:hypothetical protein